MTTLEIQYRNRRPDGHFFDPDTMRFFRSRIGSHVEANNRYYFVTSEQFKPSHGAPAARRYTARVMDLDGNVEEIGQFQAHSTSRRAFAVCQHAASRNVTASECGNGRHMADEVANAKRDWEAAGGTMTDACLTHRRNADHWAKEAGMVLEWHCIHPEVQRSNGEKLTFGQFCELIHHTPRAY